MNYLSFHAGSEGKMTRKQIKGLAGHTFRKTEQRYENHGNKDIDINLTKANIDWIRNGKSSLEEIVEERLENEYKGKRALRKDAVVVREVIAQASPSVYEGLTFKEKRQKAFEFTRDSLRWFQKEFGVENVVGLSTHMDETNPHTHFAIMPMTADGRVSQKDFFKNPNDLKRQHREFREHMNGLGWEFETENKYESVDGVSLPKYKANAKEIEKRREEQTEALQAFLSDDELRDEARGIVLNQMLSEERERLRALRCDSIEYLADIARGYAPDSLVRDLDQLAEQGRYISDPKVYRSVLHQTVVGASKKNELDVLSKRSFDSIGKDDELEFD